MDTIYQRQAARIAAAIAAAGLTAHTIQFEQFTADLKHYSRHPFKLYTNGGGLVGSYSSIDAAVKAAKAIEAADAPQTCTAGDCSLSFGEGTREDPDRCVHCGALFERDAAQPFAMGKVF